MVPVGEVAAANRLSIGKLGKSLDVKDSFLMKEQGKKASKSAVYVISSYTLLCILPYSSDWSSKTNYIRGSFSF